MHCAAPATENVPEGQERGDDMWEWGQKSPKGHSSQNDRSWHVGANEPALHAVHELFLREKKQPAQHPQSPQSQKTEGEDVCGGGGRKEVGGDTVVTGGKVVVESEVAGEEVVVESEVAGEEVVVESEVAGEEVVVESEVTGEEVVVESEVTGEEVVGGRGGVVVGGCAADEEAGMEEVGTYAVVG